MGVSVVIAYRDLGDEDRRASFRHVHAWYERFGWEIIVDAGGTEFSRAAAINAAVRRAGGDIIVQSDPDSLLADEQQLFAAVGLAAQPGLVVPHDRYLYLTREATAEVIAGRTDVGPDDCDEQGPAGMGNVTVFSRETWRRSGGFDERFGVWGGDDAAYAYATEAFCAPTRRLPGDMWHLWHPRLPQSIPGAPGYAQQFAILAQYRDAAAVGPGTVRRLVATRGPR